MKKKNEILILILLVIVQTIIYIIVGENKQYLHIDEAYSFGFAGYDKINIQDKQNYILELKSEKIL